MDLNGFETCHSNYIVNAEYGREKKMFSGLQDSTKGDLYRSIIMDESINGEDFIEGINRD